MCVYVCIYVYFSAPKYTYIVVMTTIIKIYILI